MCEKSARNHSHGRINEAFHGDISGFSLARRSSAQSKGKMQRQYFGDFAEARKPLNFAAGAFLK
jgi:hypothetical protein